MDIGDCEDNISVCTATNSKLKRRQIIIDTFIHACAIHYVKPFPLFILTAV